jgi:hypothetical protein
MIRSVVAGFFSVSVLFGTTAAQAQCTGWPVHCTGIHPGGGGMGGMGASTAIDIGFTLFSIFMDQMQQQPAPGPSPPANPSVTNGGYFATPADTPPPPNPGPSPLTLQEKSSLLNQMRPVTRGSYGTSSPSNPQVTSAVEADKAALLGQMRPITATAPTSIGGAGVTGSANPAQGQQAVQQGQPNNSKLNGPDERASANARQPFDTARQPARTAADQLCQAAGRANGCIGSFTSSGRPGASPPKLNIAATDAGVVFLQPPRHVCGVDVAMGQPVAVTGPDPLRASGMPLFGDSLDRLRSFDYSDIKANLRAMTPAQLARMRLAALQQSARLAVTIDALRIKLFQGGLAAAIPIESFGDTARKGIVDWLESTLPFWETAKKLGGGKEDEETAVAVSKFKAVKEYMKEAKEYQEKSEKVAEILGKAASDGALATAKEELAKTKEKLERSLAQVRKLMGDKNVKVPNGKPPELPGMGKLAWAYGNSLANASIAADAASDGRWGEASEYAGRAAKDLEPMAEMLLPEEALGFLGAADGYLGVAIAAIDLSAKYGNAYLDKKEKLDRKAEGEKLTRDLTAMVDALKGKQRDLDNLVRMIDEEPRCR